jgi:hypothetical protein
MTRICIPAPIAKLLIDDLPCGGFIQVDLCGSFLARLDECLKVGAKGLGNRLQGCQPLGKRLFLPFDILSQLLPCRAVGFLSGAVLRALSCPGIFFGDELGLFCGRLAGE